MYLVSEGGGRGGEGGREGEGGYCVHIAINMNSRKSHLGKPLVTMVTSFPLCKQLINDM